MPRIEILGIPVDIVTQEEVIRRIAEFFRSEGKFHIATPNPEMLVEARRNAKFLSVLQKTALNLPDGAGVVWALKRGYRSFRGYRGYRGTPMATASITSTASKTSITSRVTGTDTLLALTSLESRLCPPERIFLLGAAQGIAKLAAKKLMELNPAIKEIGTYSGSPRSEEETGIIARINSFAPTLLFVAYGAPEQDLWIARNLPRLQTVKVAMGIGGALDFIAGTRKRAPKWMQNIGLEWTWRLMLEPRRIMRIWRAVVVFPWMVMSLTSPSQSPSSRESR